MATTGPVEVTSDPIDVGLAANLNLETGTTYTLQNVSIGKKVGEGEPVRYRIVEDKPNPREGGKVLAPWDEIEVTPDGTEKVWCWVDGAKSAAVAADPVGE